MELAHLPYRKATFEDYVGERALLRLGRRKWGRYVADVVARLTAALAPDDIVLGGGNADEARRPAAALPARRQRERLPRRLPAVGRRRPARVREVRGAATRRRQAPRTRRPAPPKSRAEDAEAAPDGTTAPAKPAASARRVPPRNEELTDAPTDRAAAGPARLAGAGRALAGRARHDAARALRRRSRARRAADGRGRRRLPRLLEEPHHRRDAARCCCSSPTQSRPARAHRRDVPRRARSTSPRTAPCCTSRCARRAARRSSSTATTSCPTCTRCSTGWPRSPTACAAATWKGHTGKRDPQRRQHRHRRLRPRAR